MNTDRKNFTGRLNSDIDERLFSLDKFRGDYSDAYNCLILSAIDSGIGLVKGFKGTTEVTTSYAVPNSKKVIGKCVDLPNYKIYYFVSCATSTSNHAIYEVDVQTRVVTQVIKSSILKFTDTMRITGANVVDGKYLLYTDTINEPRNIDIVRAKAGELTTELQILAAKQPPLEEPKDVEPLTNFTFTGNNIRGNFFQFKYRYVYQDNTKSTFSPISEISTMGDLFFPTTEQTQPNYINNALNFKYLIPNTEIKRVELASRLGNTGDFGICDIIDTDVEKNYVKVAVQILAASENGVTLRVDSGAGFVTKTTTSAFGTYYAALDLVTQFNSTENITTGNMSIYVEPNTNIIYFVGNAGFLFTVTEYIPVGETAKTQQVTLSTLPIVSISTYNNYLFSNNRQLIALDVAESNLEYDRIPLKSEAQELVNGSNVVYGGITEGYDLPVMDMLASINNTDIPNNVTITTTAVPAHMGVYRTYGNTLLIPYTVSFSENPSGNGASVNLANMVYLDLDQTLYNAFKADNPNLKIYRPHNNIIIILPRYNNDVNVFATASIDPAITATEYTNSGYSITFAGVLIGDTIPIGTSFLVNVLYQGETFWYNYDSKEGDTLNDCILGLITKINNNSIGIVSYQTFGDAYSIKIFATNQEKEVAEKTLTASASVLKGAGFIKNGLKNGDSYRYAIEYLDRTGKLSTVVTNQLCEVTVPFAPENGIPNAVITVKSRPPVWAERFQILRTKRRIVNSFLQFTVNNVATNGTIFELNFNNAESNLIDYNNITGSKLSYEFAEGDRIRFIRYANGTFITSHEDLPILGVNTNGSLKIPLPKTFATTPDSLFAGVIVEVYRPNSYTILNAENELFYEIAMGGTIGDIGLSTRYHIPDNKSGVDQTQSSSTPLDIPLVMRSIEGDVWYKSTQLLEPKPDSPYLTPVELGDITILESDYQSDRYPVKTSNIGRANAFDQDARQLFRKATAYHSDAYYADSNVNNINRVYATSFKDYDQTFGAIKLFYLDGFMLYNFQENKTGTIPVNRQMVYNQDGSSSLILSSTLLNDCRYYDYVGGINNNPESFAYNQFNKYFVDIKNNAVCKIGGNGIIKISDMSMKSYFTEMFNTYKSADLTLTTQKPRFYGAWDDDNSLYVLAPEALAQGEEDPIYYPTIVFNEVVSGWTSKVEFAPACIIGAFGELFSWSPSNAKMWRHNSSATMNNFYGTQRIRTIEYASAISPETVKSYLNMTQEAAMLPADRYDGIYTGVDPSIWAVPVITTSLGQQSNLIVSDFEKMEGMYLSRFWRDSTTPVTDPLLNGDTLKGVWIKTTLTNGSTDDIGLYSTSVGFVVSK
jgi:hypothetical protein